MKISELQAKFIDELKLLLPEWRFIQSERHFKKQEGSVTWYFHITCINRTDDFDAVGDVSVEFKTNKERVCIVGAELGNIEGIGQNRFPVTSGEEAIYSAGQLYKCFTEHGLPFLIKYSDPVKVASTLKVGAKEAMLISPIINQHQDQIRKLGENCAKSM